MNVTVVIGGSSGIGKATVNKLLINGHKVINLSRRTNDECDNVFCDVTNPRSINNAFKEVYHKYGNIKNMVYSAGYVVPANIKNIHSIDWERTIATNLSGAFYATQEFIEYTNGGKIIYIASTAGTRAQPEWCAYAASKAALINFSLSMSEELKQYNINTYCVSPGRCATPLRKRLAPNEDQSKIMQSKDVADFIYYLINEGNLLDRQNIIIKQ